MKNEQKEMFLYYQSDVELVHYDPYRLGYIFETVKYRKCKQLN